MIYYYMYFDKYWRSGATVVNRDLHLKTYEFTRY